MSEDQKSKYEEVAEGYSPFGSLNPIGSTQRELFETRKRHFLAGTEHAHPIGFNLGKEEGKKEGWNEAIMAVQNAMSQHFEFGFLEIEVKEFYTQLQKLRK